MKLWKIFIIPCLLVAKMALAGEVLVVSAESSGLNSVSVKQVQAAFLSQPADDGPQIVAVDRQQTPEHLREIFYEKAVGRSITRMKAHWSQLVFTGRGAPPDRAADLDDLKKILKAKPLAVSYVDASENTSGLKVLLRLSGE